MQAAWRPVKISNHRLSDAPFSKASGCFSRPSSSDPAEGQTARRKPWASHSQLPLAPSPHPLFSRPCTTISSKHAPRFRSVAHPDLATSLPLMLLVTCVRPACPSDVQPRRLPAKLGDGLRCLSVIPACRAGCFKRDFSPSTAAGWQIFALPAP